MQKKVQFRDFRRRCFHASLAKVPVEVEFGKNPNSSPSRFDALWNGIGGPDANCQTLLPIRHFDVDLTLKRGLTQIGNRKRGQCLFEDVDRMAGWLWD